MADLSGNVFEIEQEFIDSAIELIDEFVPLPNAIWCSLADNVVANPSKPYEITRPVKTEYQVRIVFEIDDLEDRQFLKYRKNAETQEGQVNGIMYDHGFTVSLKDYVIVNNQKLVVRSIDKVAPMGTTILYLLEFGT